MNTAFFIAKRYFISKKKKNFINVITILSVVGVALGTMALIFVLSIFNGLEELIRSIYGNFDPHLKVTLAEGKSFALDSSRFTKLRNLDGIQYITEVVEDNALVKYADKQAIIKMKGVSEDFQRQFGINKYVVEGNSKFYDHGVPMALLGRGVQYQLGVDMNNRFYQLQFWYPKNQKKLQLNPEKAFNAANLYPGGVFTLEKQYDDFYVFVPLGFAAELMDYENKRTALEINIKDVNKIEKVRAEIRKILGNSFKISTVEEQHAGMLRAIKIEKLFVYITFSFILAVSSLNLFFALTMMAIEKRKDMQMLVNMGSSSLLVRNVFIFEGLIIGSIGAGIGLFLGFIISYLQQKYGFISMGTETSLVNSYPIKMQWIDFMATGIIIFTVTILISLQPALKAMKTK